MPVAFAADDVVKRYGRTTALDGVSIHVDEGELVGLLGPNGAGKSTLVKIGCGLVRPTRGSASVCGAPAGSAAARANLGYLAELFRFPGWMTADELLADAPGPGRVATGAAASAAGCSSWSAWPTSPTGGWSRCRRACSSGSGSPRR